EPRYGVHPPSPCRPETEPRHLPLVYPPVPAYRGRRTRIWPRPLTGRVPQACTPAQGRGRPWNGRPREGVWRRCASGCSVVAGEAQVDAGGDVGGVGPAGGDDLAAGVEVRAVV